MNKVAKLANKIRSIIFPTHFIHDISEDDFSKLVEQHLHVSILYTDSEIASGFLRWNSKYKIPEIVITRSENGFPERQKFTIAHELGHLYLHWEMRFESDKDKWIYDTKLPNVGKSHFKILNADPTEKYIRELSPTMYRGYKETEDSSVEKEANEFAADLLMPEDNVISIYKESQSTDLDYVKFKIRDFFDVSLDAAWHRLNDLQKRHKLS